MNWISNREKKAVGDLNGEINWHHILMLQENDTNQQFDQLFVFNSNNNEEGSEKFKFLHVEKKKKRKVWVKRMEANDRVKNFDVLETKSYKGLNKKFGFDFSFEQLKNIATIFSQRFNCPLDRDAFRYKIVLYKWFDENWETISCEFNNLIVFDEDFKVLSKKQPEIPSLDAEIQMVKKVSPPNLNF